MPEILSYPFELRAGRAMTVEQDSDEAHAQQLAVLILTRKGERPLVPTFGITDPAFAGIDAGEVIVGVQTFGPPVDIADVVTVIESDTVQSVAVEFESDNP